MLDLGNRISNKYFPGIASLLGVAAIWSAVAGGAGRGQLTPTEETSIGIYHIPDVAETRNLWQTGDPGERLLLRGRVVTSSGTPISDAQVELWQADGSGQVHDDRYRTRLHTRPDGSFGVTTAMPGYIPGAPGIWGARDIHVVVTHGDYAQLISLILFKGATNLVGLPYPKLAVFVEQGQIKDQTMRFAEAVLVLSAK